mmetsp:Transcript_41774/g.89022  ORF Transcript_41774/g.89022 Transcript_41774/m.89022 type:complete len:294 (+) Transcript_41774:2253-3134(+)
MCRVRGSGQEGHVDGIPRHPEVARVRSRQPEFVRGLLDVLPVAPGVERHDHSPEPAVPDPLHGVRQAERPAGLRERRRDRLRIECHVVGLRGFVQHLHRVIVEVGGVQQRHVVPAQMILEVVHHRVGAVVLVGGVLDREGVQVQPAQLGRIGGAVRDHGHSHRPGHVGGAQGSLVPVRAHRGADVPLLVGPQQRRDGVGGEVSVVHHGESRYRGNTHVAPRHFVGAEVGDHRRVAVVEVIDRHERRGHVIHWEVDGELLVGFRALVREGEEGHDRAGRAAVGVVLPPLLLVVG